MTDREQRIADFRAGARWCATQYEALAQRSANSELARLMDDMDRFAGIHDAPLGPTDSEIVRALGLLPEAEVRPEGVTAADVLAMQAVAAESKRMVRRRMCEQAFLYRLAKWVHEGMSPIDAFSPMHNAATDLFACGEPWQHPDFEIKPPAKEEPK